jgi:5-hydroxyisourate hydrolase
MTLSTHVLDITVGRPAAGVAVRLQRLDGSSWVPVSAAVTDDDGRVAALLRRGTDAGAGTYQLLFDVATYFAGRDQETFYALVAIEFVVRDEDQHYHVPLLLSPYGYSTYRGS